MARDFEDERAKIEELTLELVEALEEEKEWASKASTVISDLAEIVGPVEAQEIYMRCQNG